MTELTELTELNYSSIGWTVARLARQVEVALATLELSPAQYRMLVQIARGTDASSSLAQKLAVSAPSVTSVVETLVQRGAVERAHSAADRSKVRTRTREPSTIASDGTLSEIKQGSSAACASTTTRPSPSYREGKTKQSITLIM